jgi:hypothetical protein
MKKNELKVKQFLKKLSKTEKIKNFHKQSEISFEKVDLSFLPTSDWNLKIHKSINKSWLNHGKQTSEYNLIVSNNVVYYSRKSNHWGTFFPRDDNGEIVTKNWKILSEGVDNSDKKLSQLGIFKLETLQELAEEINVTLAPVPVKCDYENKPEFIPEGFWNGKIKGDNSIIVDHKKIFLTNLQVEITKKYLADFELWENRDK